MDAESVNKHCEKWGVRVTPWGSNLGGSKDILMIFMSLLKPNAKFKILHPTPEWTLEHLKLTEKLMVSITRKMDVKH